MSLISLSSVAVQFGATPLLQDVTFAVEAGERWGIVGRNGTGKTTLFRIMEGALEPSDGSITRKPGLRIALLDQHRDFGAARTVWEAAAQGYAHLIALERSLARQVEVLEELGAGVTSEDLARYDREQERFQREGGYAFPARVDAVLQGLGFDADQARTQPLDQLSGGERGRVGLAGQLATPSDVVLLDEPTNHLDLDTIEWLKRYLEDAPRTVLVISHDRAFLDEVADHVLHVSNGTATPYRGGYSAFVRQRDRARLSLERRAAEQQKEIARQEDFIRRNIAGQKTTQAKSRRAMLARLPRLSPPPSEEEAMAVRFQAAERGGDQALIVEKLAVRVGGRTLLEDFTVLARRGDVVALVGPNGAGKTTLLSVLMGERPPDRGKARLGAGVTTAWFRQDHAHLPSGRSLYDCIADARPAWNRGQIQAHLGRFGFSGDSVRRRTDSLSGGERARVALALITLAEANLLALDEPTNHLDVESIEALEDALEGYEGTVLLVSHDRALLRELATRVWVFQGRRVLDYPGPFVDWEAEVSRRAANEAEAARAAEEEAREAARARSRKTVAANKAIQAVKRELRREVEASEEEVHRAEARVAELEAALGDEALYDGTAGGAMEAGRISVELAEARRAVDEAIARWLEAQEAMEDRGS